MRRIVLSVLGLLALPSLALGEEAWSVPDFLDELRLGVSAHDLDSGGHRREDGVNVDMEVLFSPFSSGVENPVMHFILTPRPHVGAHINTSGNTSAAYAGLTWHLDVVGPVFVEGTFGGAIHNGETRDVDPNREPLGCRALFRESAALGVDITEQVRVMASIVHMSNAGLCDHNPGLTNVGVNVGYRF